MKLEKESIQNRKRKKSVKWEKENIQKKNEISVKLEKENI